MKARFRRTTEIVYDVLSDTKFPVDIIKLASQHYEILDLAGWPDNPLSQRVKTTLVCSVFGKTLILYNSRLQNYYWHVAHALGHLELGHFIFYNDLMQKHLCDSFTNDDIKILDQEADCFADNILQSFYNSAAL